MASSNRWQSGSSWVRRRFARNPKKRMRTKPRGSTCSKNRRRNSLATHDGGRWRRVPSSVLAARAAAWLRAHPLLRIPCESAANPTTATLPTVAGGHLASEPPSTPGRRDEVTRFLVVSALRWGNGLDRKVHGTRDSLEVSTNEPLR